ncbi:MAG: radical SAM protein [Planctomycetota bacterium]|jgi:organic radical activating enzyme
MPIPEDLQVHVLDLELNGGCNYRCQMCPQAMGREKPFLRKLPFDVFEKILDDGMQYGLKTVTLHGSGEPTLNRDMPRFVKAIKERNLICISFTNGLKLTAKLSSELIEAGIDILRLSAIGYDRETYNQWMEGGDYDLVRDNARRFVDLAKGTASEMHINNLIIDPEETEYEVRMYVRNWAEFTGAASEIWLMHNWSDSEKIKLNYARGELFEPRKERTCGRPFAPLLQVRAGGLENHRAAVVACCMVLGKDSQGVLGHLDSQTIAEVVSGAPYRELREAHAEGRFDDIPYCKGCDQLLETPEALVWSNIAGREYGQSKNLPTLNFLDYGNPSTY